MLRPIAWGMQSLKEAVLHLRARCRALSSEGCKTCQSCVHNSERLSALCTINLLYTVVYCKLGPRMLTVWACRWCHRWSGRGGHHTCPSQRKAHRPELTALCAPGTCRHYTLSSLCTWTVHKVLCSSCTAMTSETAGQLSQRQGRGPDLMVD